MVVACVFFVNRREFISWWVVAVLQAVVVVASPADLGRNLRVVERAKGGRLRSSV
jgi:hypothetical protein